MSTEQRVIKLYIQPSVGPLSEIELDLTEIETAALAYPGAARDEARTQEVMARIRKQFGKLDVEGRKAAIKNIVARFHHAYYFDGMVLCLQGTIDGAATATDGRSAESFKSMAQDVQKIKQQLAEERRKNDALRARMELVQDENKRLIRRYKEVGAEAETLHLQLTRAESEVRRAQEEVRRLRTQIAQSEQDDSALQTRLELAQKQLQAEQEQQRQQTEQAQQQSLTELALLRQSVSRARETEAQLRETLEKRDNEITELRARIRRLTEGAETEDGQVQDETLLYDDL